MRVKTFTAPDMPTAMKIMREALGDGAIILASEPDKGRSGIRVTAASEGDDDDTPAPSKQNATPVRDNAALDHLRFELRNVLRFHNVPEIFIAKMMQKASDAELQSVASLHRIGAATDPYHLLLLTLEKITSSYFDFAPLPADLRGMRLMLAGPPGIGKTLTISRMAARLAMDRKPVTVITTDNKRAGGIEQLQAFTTILGLQLKVATTPAELTQHLRVLPADGQALIDTAGCNPYDAEELKELKAYATIPGVEPVLVLPAGGDSLETIDIVEALMALPLHRLMITRTDTARRLGGILAAAAAHGLAFCNASTSPRIIDPLQPLDSATLAQLLLRYQLKS